MPREVITLECTEAKAEGKPVSRYLSSRNKKTVTERVQKKKYNPLEAPHMQYEILRTLGRIGGEGVEEELLEAAISLDWRLRLAAAEVLPVHFRDKKALDALRALLQDKKMIVRETAAKAVGEAKLVDLVPELIVLMREGYVRAKEKSYVALCAVSGQDYGYAPDVWQKWWHDRKAEKLTEEGKLEKGQRITVSQYYDFEIFSDRVLFVVDVSGSMKWPSYNPNRITVARDELTKAVQALDEKSYFNMATFAGHVNMWRPDGEVLATVEKVSSRRTRNRRTLSASSVPEAHSMPA